MLGKIGGQHWPSSQKHALFLLLSLLVFSKVWAKTPKNDFCRRFSHQSTVIDNRLYIDGGYVNYAEPQDRIGEKQPNTWLGYHDLDNLVTSQGQLRPDFNINLNKNTSQVIPPGLCTLPYMLIFQPYRVPTVAGGILWPDSVNKRFYLYGGDRTTGDSDSNALFGYDILNDYWNTFEESDSAALVPNISAYGAGVGVSETGMGFYLGGWTSKKSMKGGPRNRKMSSDFYSYNYDKNEFRPLPGLDKVARAEGGIVWIPAGEAPGLLVYLGGLVSQHGNDTSSQALDEIFIFDLGSEKWYKEKAQGIIPQNRRQFCMDVAWAPDKSSFNMWVSERALKRNRVHILTKKDSYLWGGLAVHPPITNVTSYSDVYILSLPSFNWVKAQPSTPGNSTGVNGRYGSTCNMVRDMSQMFIIGGDFSNKSITKCDVPDMWGVHNLWTGTSQNAGNNESWWGVYDKEVDSNVVPAEVYSVIGGDKNGGATLKEPKGGFSSYELSLLFSRQRATYIRKPTRKISRSPRVGTGAIVGIVIGSLVVLGLVLCVWYSFGKRVLQRREQRYQSQVIEEAQQLHQSHRSQQAHYSLYDGSTSTGQSLITPHSPEAHWDMGSPPGSPDLRTPLALTELPADHALRRKPRRY